MAWIYLGLAIACEVAATLSLPSCAGFSKLSPSLIVVLGYATAFFFLSLAVKHIPLSYAYAIWCGIGIVCISLLNWIIHQETLNLGAAIGIALIATGAVVLKLA